MVEESTEPPGKQDRQAFKYDRRKNAGPMDQEYGSQRNSGETYGPTRLERADSSDAKLYRVPKMDVPMMDETSTGEGGCRMARINFPRPVWISEMAAARGRWRRPHERMKSKFISQ
jgi:hypothetical protein